MALLASADTDDDNEMGFDFHFPTSKKALIIFTKNPEKGKVKTRLAKSIGDEAALRVYDFLVQHTVKLTTGLNVDKFVYYSDIIHRKDHWDPEIFRKKIQSGKDLGERMESAFSEVLAMGYERAVIIGCDLYDLCTHDLLSAFDALSNNDYVLGPAMDGGYYLLGIKAPTPKLFKQKPWSTSEVLGRTLEDIKGEKYFLLEKRNDIDYYEDLAGLEIFDQFLPPGLKIEHRKPSNL